MEKPDLSLYPNSPGVYLYKNAKGKIIYVGKARRLRQRIASYFRAEASLPIKTRVMLSHAKTLDFLNTSTDKEAFLLEASLIKKHLPQYNIALRDDAEYILFRIATNVDYPRLEIIRHSAKNRKKEGKVFGPFPSAIAARATWKFINRHFPLRTCKDRDFANRTRPCLNYHIGQCLAPCTEHVPPEEYKKVIQKVSLFLSGRSRELLENLRNEMNQAAEDLFFEKAAILRDQLKAIETTIEKQSVILAPKTDLDIIGIATSEHGISLGLIFVRDGLLLSGRNFFWPAIGLEDIPELLYSFLLQFYLSSDNRVPQKIILPWLPQSNSLELSQRNQEIYTQKIVDHVTNEAERVSWEELFEGLETTFKERSSSNFSFVLARNEDEKKLLQMAAQNAQDSRKDSTERQIATRLAHYFGVSKPIDRIEMVDISHTAGSHTRAGAVVFENGKESKKDYRLYKLDEDLAAANKSFGDDYAALYLWAKRRLQSELPWPDLLLIDGGRGQLAAVHRAFAEEEKDKKVLLAAIAKARTEDNKADRRAGNVSDRIFIPLRQNPLNIPAASPELLYLQRVRDTAHDFVIGRHRQARTHAALQSELSQTPGIGPVLSKTILTHFSSPQELYEASILDLEKISGIGKKKAHILKTTLTRLKTLGNETQK